MLHLPVLPQEPEDITLERFNSEHKTNITEESLFQCRMRLIDYNFLSEYRKKIIDQAATRAILLFATIGLCIFITLSIIHKNGSTVLWFILFGIPILFLLSKPMEWVFRFLIPAEPSLESQGYYSELKFLALESDNEQERKRYSEKLCEIAKGLGESVDKVKSFYKPPYNGNCDCLYSHISLIQKMKKYYELCSDANCIDFKETEDALRANYFLEASPFACQLRLELYVHPHQFWDYEEAKSYAQKQYFRGITKSVAVIQEQTISKQTIYAVIHSKSTDLQKMADSGIFKMDVIHP